MRPYLPPYEQQVYGGINDGLDPELVSKFEGAYVQNGDIRTVGAFKGRLGATLVGSDTGSQMVTGWGIKINPTKFITRIVNGASNAVVEALSGATFSTIASSTLLKDTAINTAECSNGKVYYFDGDATKDPGAYNGSAWSTIAGMPRGKGGAEWKNFFWVWGVSAYPRRLYLSNIGVPETYSASDYLDLPEDIVGIKAYGTRLVIGMKHSIVHIEGYGSSDFVASGKTLYDLTAFDFGIASQESMQIVGNELWGMDQEGRIRRLYRSQNDVLFGGVVSDKIENFIKTLNTNALAKVTAAYVNGYYIFYAPSSGQTENDVGAYYDTRAILPKNVSRWQIHTGWHPSHFCVYESSNTPELYWGENRADTKSYKWAGFSDNGTVIDMIWRSGKYNNGLPNRPKLYRYGKQQYKSIGDYTGLIRANIDDRGMNTIKTVSFLGNDPIWGTDVWGAFIWGTQGRLDSDFLFNAGGDDIVGKTVQIELKASYSAAIPEWYKQTYMYKALKMR